MRKLLLIALGLVGLYLIVMRPWECVSARVDGGGGGAGMNGDLATWIDCSY